MKHDLKAYLVDTEETDVVFCLLHTIPPGYGVLVSTQKKIVK